MRVSALSDMCSPRLVTSKARLRPVGLRGASWQQAFADSRSFEAEAPTLLPTLRLWTFGCNVAVLQRLKGPASTLRGHARLGAFQTEPGQKRQGSNLILQIRLRPAPAALLSW